MRHCILLLTLCLGLPAGCRSWRTPTVDPAGRSAEVLGALDVKLDEHAAESADVSDASLGYLSQAEAIRRAVMHDPRLQTALAKVRSAAADSQQARLLPNPVLSVSVRLPSAGRGSPIVDAGLGADLLAILQQPRRASAADARLRVAAEDVLNTLADVLSDVQEAYAAVQAGTQTVSTLQERERITHKLLDVGRAKLKAGEAAGLDVITLDAQRVQIEVDLAEKRQELREVRLELANLIGQPSSDAAWAVEAWADPSPARAPESVWIAAGLAHRADVRAKQWELASLGDEVAIAKLAIWEGTNIGAQAEQDERWTIGPALSVPLPIFDWGQAKTAKASAELDAARHEMTLLIRKTIRETRAQWSSYNATAEILRKASHELLPLQEERTAKVEAAYRAGEQDLANLLLAEEDLLDTRLKVIELRKKNATAKLKLQRAVGGIGIADMVENAPVTTQPTTAPAKVGER